MTTYNERHKALSGCYQLWVGSSDACAYCGVVGDTYDHVPPLSKLHALGLEWATENNVRLLMVPACRECNSLLCSFGGDTITARKRFVKGKLRKRYGKFLGMPHWTPDQMDDLGPNLRLLVESGVNIGEWVRRRLAW